LFDELRYIVRAWSGAAVEQTRAKRTAGTTMRSRFVMHELVALLCPPPCGGDPANAPSSHR
jgi:hypothetical protein